MAVFVVLSAVQGVRMRCTFCVLVLLLWAAPIRGQTTVASVKSHIPRLEKCLEENILRFWLSKSVDRTHGGYTINFGPDGESKGPGTRGIVTQARTLWMFARAAREGYGNYEQLMRAAEHGWNFLRDSLWDRTHGGFYWEVDARGAPLRPKKHMYGQAFALYALSEYYLASHRKDVLDFASMFFELLDSKAHDREYGGYRESFETDWQVQQAGPEPGYLGDPSLKLMNTHLHLLESITAFYRASRSPLARERLIELITIESNAVVRKGLTACTDKYSRDWKPRLEGDYARVSYGHDLENIWLLADACKAAGLPVYPFIDLFESVFAYALEYGYDRLHGGFWYAGGFRKPADDRRKSWWVQSEALVSALYMYRMTGDKKYLEVFDQTWRFVDRYQVDWKHGEWWPVVSEDLKPQGDKGDIWKAGYHNARAMIECLAILHTLR